MRTFAFAIAAAGLLALAGTAFSQSIEIGPRGFVINPYDQDPGPPRYRGRSVGRYDCDELRRACLYKEELGEEGAGNCRRYRRHCQDR